MKTKYNQNILYVALYAFGISNCHAEVGCGSCVNGIINFITNIRYIRLTYSENVERILNDNNKDNVNYYLLFKQIRGLNILYPNEVRGMTVTVRNSLAEFIIKNHEDNGLNYDSLLQQIARLDVLSPHFWYSYNTRDILYQPLARLVIADHKSNFIINHDEPNNIDHDGLSQKLQRLNALYPDVADYITGYTYRSLAECIIQNHEDNGINCDSLLQQIERLND